MDKGLDTPVWNRDEPDSPCVNICVLDTRTGYCLGCFRTSEEIAGWGKLSNAERVTLRQALPMRESVVNNRPRTNRRRKISR